MAPTRPSEMYGSMSTVAPEGFFAFASVSCRNVASLQRQANGCVAA